MHHSLKLHRTKNHDLNIDATLRSKYIQKERKIKLFQNI